MLRDVTHKISDGLLGFSTAKGDGIHLKIGVSSAESDTLITITGNMTAEQIKNRLGLSPLSDAVMDSIEWGSNRIYCIPVSATTAGTNGTVTKTGTGSGNLTVSGSPHNAFDVIIKVTGQGKRNTALFVYSINGGYSYSDEITVPMTGAFEIPSTGLTVTFTEGVAPNQDTSFLVGDLYRFATTAPSMTNGDVLAAIEKLRHMSIEYEFVHIVGESTLNLWQAVSEAQKELQETYKKPMFFVLEAYTPNTNEDMEDYAARLEADRKKVKNFDIQVVAARGLLVKMDGTTREVNLAGLVSGLYSKAPVQVCIGKTREEAGFGITKAKLLELRPKGVEEITELLDVAGYLTFRGYDGLEYFYVYHTKMMCPDGSDYRYAEDVRVLNKIIRETRKEGLLLLQDDIDIEDIQGELETRAKFMYAPLQKMIDNKEISSAEITVPEGQEDTILEDEKMRVKIRYVSRGYIREVEVDIGRTQPSD
jgi:hypothetical protein